MKSSFLTKGFVVLTLVASVACQKKDEGGGAPAPTPAPAPSPQAAPPPPPPPPAPAATPACQDKSFGSVDIAEGKILCRKFSLFYGAVRESGKEACHSDEFAKSVNFSGFLYKGHDEVSLQFDQSGNLSMTIKNYSGEYKNEQPIPYTLDGNTQEIILGAFRLVGIPSQPYVRQALAQGSIIERYHFMKLGNSYDVSGSRLQIWNQLNGVNPTLFGTGGVGTQQSFGGYAGFNADFKTGQQQNAPQDPNAWQAPVNAPGSPNSGYIAANFEGGLRIGVRVAAPMYPQHVTRLFVWPDSETGNGDQAYQSDIFVTSGNIQCKYKGQTQLRVILQ